MKLPNAYLIGVQKAGTSSLFDWLSQHPDIFGPQGMKDFHFFSNNEHWRKGLKFYRDFFKKHKNEKIIMAGGVNLIYFTDCFKRIKKVSPEAKMLLVIRNPIDRAFSGYNHAVFTKQETEATSFEEAIKLEKTRKLKAYQQKSYLTYVGHGFYYKQIKEFAKYFPLKRLHIILFEDLKNNPQKVVREVFEFLGVNPDFKPNFKVVNKTGEVRFKWINRLMYELEGFRKVVFSLPIIDSIISADRRAIIRRALKDWNTRDFRSKPKVKKETRKALAQVYKKDVKSLEKLVNRDLSHYLK